MSKKRESGTLINMGADPNWLIRLKQPLAKDLREVYERVYVDVGLAESPPKPSLAQFAGYAIARGLDVIQQELSKPRPLPAKKKQV